MGERCLKRTLNRGRGMCSTPAPPYAASFAEGRDLCVGGASDDQRVPGPSLPPPFTASTVEMVCRALGEAVRGHQIADLLAVLKVSEGASEASATNWKRLFNAVAVFIGSHALTAAVYTEEHAVADRRAVSPMSSRCRKTRRSSVLVGVEVAVDDAGEAAFQTAQGLGVGHAFGLLLPVVGLPEPVEADLGDRDPMDRGVELAVA